MSTSDTAYGKRYQEYCELAKELAEKMSKEQVVAMLANLLFTRHNWIEHAEDGNGTREHYYVIMTTVCALKAGKVYDEACKRCPSPKNMMDFLNAPGSSYAPLPVPQEDPTGKEGA